MALKKPIPTSYGINATHWKASSINIDYVGMQAQSICLGYTSQKAMDGDSTHIDYDKVSVKLFYRQEDIDATKPDRLRELEKLVDHTAEEITEQETLTNGWSKEQVRFLLTTEMVGAFQTILCYQYQFHLAGDKLKDATNIL